MKKLFPVILLSMGLFLFKPNILFAQNDTLDIGATDAFNISNIINGDTLAGGIIKNQNRVYRLQRGVIYQLDQTITINGSFKMIATPGTNRPPVLAAKILADNSSIARYFQCYGTSSKDEFENIYFLGIRQDGQISNALNSGISILADSISLNVSGCVFDGFGARGIQIFVAGRWAKINVQDCEFRNLIYPGGSWLYGQAFKTTSNTTPLDTVKFINNTFLACGSYIFGVSGYVNYGLFDHNTILYGVGNTFLCAYNTNVHLTNNIVYSTFVAMGYKPAVYGDWFYPRPDTVSSGIIVVNIPDTIAFRDTTLIMPGESYLIDTAQGVTPSMINQQTRVLDVNHNDYFYPSKLTNFITTYNDTVKSYTDVTFPGGSASMLNTIAQPRWMNDYTKNILTTKVPQISPLINIDDNTTYNLDPQFNDPDAVNLVDSLIGKLTEILTNNITTNRWTYKLVYPPVWPLPEDLSYTNSTLLTASTGGFPLGDLNWFPNKKAEWETWITDVKEDKGAAVPVEFNLQQNYPNPFNPTTEIKFSIAKSGFVTLRVYNILGQEVAILVNKELRAGNFSVSFNASKLASGTYIYQLTTNGVQISKKMMLLK